MFHVSIFSGSGDIFLGQPRLHSGTIDWSGCYVSSVRDTLFPVVRFVVEMLLEASGETGPLQKGRYP